MCLSRIKKRLFGSDAYEAVLLQDMVPLSGVEIKRAHSEAKTPIDEDDMPPSRITYEPQHIRKNLISIVETLEKRSFKYQKVSLKENLTFCLATGAIAGFAIYHYISSKNGFYESMNSFNQATSMIAGNSCAIQYSMVSNRLSKSGFNTMKWDCEDDCDHFFLSNNGLLCQVPTLDATCYNFLNQLCSAPSMSVFYKVGMIALMVVTSVACFGAGIQFIRSFNAPTYQGALTPEERKQIAELPKEFHEELRKDIMPLVKRDKENYFRTQLEGRRVQNIEEQLNEMLEREFELYCEIPTNLLKTLKRCLKEISAEPLLFCMGSKSEGSTIHKFFKDPIFDKKLLHEIFDYTYDASGMTRVSRV